MDWDDVRQYCMTQKGATEDYPFDAYTLVIKVGGKMFALLGSPPKEDSAGSVNLKCDPEWALILRANYPSVTAGYHMNKQHWNTVILDGSIPDDEVIEMIDHSYQLVVKSLTKRARQDLGLAE
jgi:predicted DNA-binding protein (MmcQ/YjbR family)